MNSIPTITRTTREELAIVDGLLEQLEELRMGVRVLFTDLSNPTIVGNQGLLGQVDQLGESCLKAQGTLSKVSILPIPDQETLFKSEEKEEEIEKEDLIREDASGSTATSSSSVLVHQQQRDAIQLLQDQMGSMEPGDPLYSSCRQGQKRRHFTMLDVSDPDGLEEYVYELGEKYGLDVGSFTKGPGSEESEGHLMRLCLRLGHVLTLAISLWLPPSGEASIEGVWVGSAEMITYEQVIQGSGQYHLTRHLTSMATSMAEASQSEGTAGCLDQLLVSLPS
ncbi:hypothetical protein BJ684DRAFT_18420 [Piptocephalis cylindrospora]|uniref:Uncharacterized protein n=1 Tax=Piptocephalis cylindrospora TaxID=1907219 RepID=A0A4V1IYP0_9FUNG|nr:hypothetical protein BJ684DRAFT_18420 [Piptocephalis cylindrospora]|eukprot:RKP15229.1 hypothetical protein BJ684DRAFT_18420 [Piptocephalis cylindrospora]